MKKTFLVMACLLISVSTLFAVNTGTLSGGGSINSAFDLTLNLGSNSSAGWFTSEPTDENWDTVGIAEDDDVAFTAGPETAVVMWAGVKSNENVPLSLTVTGEPLSVDGGNPSSLIGIHAVGETGAFGDVSIEWNADSSDANLSLTEGSALTGTRIVSGKVTFTMDADDYAAALSNPNYSADILLTVASEG